MELGLNKLLFDSKKTTLKQLIKGPICGELIFSNACIGNCGNAYDPENYNYLKMISPHACNFEYFEFRFNETPGIKKWKDYVWEDMNSMGFYSTDEDRYFWQKFKSKYRELAITLWEDQLPTFISNKED